MSDKRFAEILKAKISIEKILKENNVSLKAAGWEKSIFLMDNSDLLTYAVMATNKKETKK